MTISGLEENVENVYKTFVNYISSTLRKVETHQITKNDFSKVLSRIDIDINELERNFRVQIKFDTLEEAKDMTLKKRKFI